MMTAACPAPFVWLPTLPQRASPPFCVCVSPPPARRSPTRSSSTASRTTTRRRRPSWRSRCPRSSRSGARGMDGCTEWGRGGHWILIRKHGVLRERGVKTAVERARRVRASAPSARRAHAKPLRLGSSVAPLLHRRPQDAAVRVSRGLPEGVPQAEGARPGQGVVGVAAMAQQANSSRPQYASVHADAPSTTHDTASPLAAALAGLGGLAGRGQQRGRRQGGVEAEEEDSRTKVWLVLEEVGVVRRVQAAAAAKQICSLIVDCHQSTTGMVAIKVSSSLAATVFSSVRS